MHVTEPIPHAPAGAPPQETFVLNLGPQHPATHGVLRLKLTMDGEYIMHAEPVCGYIHRMQEKMGENRTYAQFLPNTSRIDYLSAMNYTHAFVGAVERAAKLQVPPRAEYIRVITSEMNRISSHLVWWGAFLLDLGGFTPLLYAFDDREKILDLLEGITGSRLTASRPPSARSIHPSSRASSTIASSSTFEPSSRTRTRSSPTASRRWRSDLRRAVPGRRTDRRRTARGVRRG